MGDLKAYQLKRNTPMKLALLSVTAIAADRSRGYGDAADQYGTGEHGRSRELLSQI
jgi:hypothetical protein